ncbi:MAG: hypothetical protein ACLT3Y_05415 [Ruminococcus callidus]
MGGRQVVSGMHRGMAEDLVERRSFCGKPEAGKAVRRELRRSVRQICPTVMSGDLPDESLPVGSKIR